MAGDFLASNSRDWAENVGTLTRTAKQKLSFNGYAASYGGQNPETNVHRESKDYSESKMKLILETVSCYSKKRSLRADFYSLTRLCGDHQLRKSEISPAQIWGLSKFFRNCCRRGFAWDLQAVV